MNYYEFHVGDYKSATDHLNPLEDIAYRRLIDLYYQSEAQMPGEFAPLVRKIRMAGYEAEVQSVLDEFFVREGDKWRNKRADEEITLFQHRRAKAVEAGLESARQRALKAAKFNDKPKANDRSTTVEQPLNEASTSHLPSPISQYCSKEHTPLEFPKGEQASPVKETQERKWWEGEESTDAEVAECIAGCRTSTGKPAFEPPPEARTRKLGARIDSLDPGGGEVKNLFDAFTEYVGARRKPPYVDPLRALGEWLSKREADWRRLKASREPRYGNPHNARHEGYARLEEVS